MARIYVSSTFSDLADYRKEVGLALRRLGHQDIAMEYNVAEDKRPLDRCLEDVASCDVYVGIFAWRYGYIPDSGNPDNLSITELEYRHALAQGKPCLIFLLSDEAPWPPAKMERAALDRIDALRQELASRHEAGLFEDTNDLVRKVNEAVIHWEKQTGLVIQREQTDWDAYRRAVWERHQWVRLQVIAGGSKERGPLRIPLTEVFEPQLVVAGASGTGVPDEIRQYQQEIYGGLAQAEPDVDPVPDGQTDTDAGDGDDHLFSGNPEEVLDVLGRERTQVILGGPGSGKSTLLQHTMLIACADSGEPANFEAQPIPFLVDLRTYVLQGDTGFVSHIVRRSNEFYSATLDARSIDVVLSQDRRSLVFFDGLDEVFDPNDRRRVIEQFQAFATRYPNARIVVTSRIAGYDRTSLGLAGFEHYTLMPLTLSHIRNFTKHWYRHYTLEGTDRTAQGLVQRIVESPRLLDLAGNPLLLTMMAVIYKDRDLPNERWRLYERCAETLLEDWDLSKGIENEDFKLAVVMRTAQKSELLQRVAMYMLEHHHGETGSELNAIAYAPLLGIFADYLEEKYLRPRGEADAIAVDILKHLMERTYVLAGIGERIFGFVHRTFMEYFAACHCQAQFNARKSDFPWLTQDIFGAHWPEAEWEEVLLLLAAMLHDQGTPIHDVVEHLWHHVEGMQPPMNVAFAAQCLGEAGDVQDQDQARELLGELTFAIQKRASRPHGLDNAFVGSALKSFAVLAPLLLDAADIAQEPIARLTSSGTVAGRTTAWQMGFALRSRKERLAYALDALKDSEEAVRRGAISALEREWPGRADIGPTLAAVVERDRQTRVRSAALGAILRSWHNEPSILDAIANRADDETTHTFVDELIGYLASAWPGNRRALELVGRLAAPRIHTRTKYDQASVIDTAIFSLAQGWRGDRMALALLRQLIGRNSQVPHSGESGNIPKAAPEVIAMGWAGNSEAFTLLRTLIIPEPGQLGYPGVPTEMRLAAIQSIAKGWVGDGDAFAFLRTLAVSGPERPEYSEAIEKIRVAAVQAIAAGWAGEDDAFTFLWSLAAPGSGLGGRRGESPIIRESAQQAIGRYWAGEARAHSFFRELMANHPDPQTRFLAFRTLVYAISQKWRRLPHNVPEQGVIERALEDLRDGFDDKDDAIREAAILVASDLSDIVPYPYAEILDVLGLMTRRAEYDPKTRIRVIAMESLAWYSHSITPESFSARSQIGLFFRKNEGFLREIARDSPEVTDRVNAIWALADGCSSDDQLLVFLQDRAVKDPRPRVRASALQAIGFSWGSDPRALTFLREQANKDPSPESQAIARQVLSELGEGKLVRHRRTGVYRTYSRFDRLIEDARKAVP